MNNTRTLAAIAAILIAATLVAGGTLAATPSASAYTKKGSHNNGSDKIKGNGNTDTIQACLQRGTQSGFDNSFEQECQNLICTHPGNNATCVTPVTPVTPPGEVGCPEGTLYNVQLQEDLNDGTTIPTGTILCLPKKLGNQEATISTLTPVDAITTFDVVVANPNISPCPESPTPGFSLAKTISGDAGPPIGTSGTVCIKKA